ncbi:MAG: RNA helicase [Peptococcaceae bacterium]|jgi:ATP-dependent RNA helicase HelY|nr:RNA helicase [Peptococcaceae bacterium]
MMELPEVSCSEIIDAIQDKLPVLFFVFSRGRTELLAQELGREWDFLNYQEKKEVVDLIKNAEAEQPGAFNGPGWRNLRRLLQQGIAYHHAGLLPPVKYLIEKLYASRMLWVVFCTETFAAGVNFPAASAVFDSTRKWDGHDFRILQNREFYQMAGRAGRRGYDRIGHAFIRVDSRFPEQTGFFDEKAIEPVSGRLVISPNTVLSLLRYKTDEEINRFLNENFKMYQLKKKQKVLQEELAALSQRLSDLSANMCSEYGRLTCPVERARARKKLKRKHWKNKNREMDLLQKQLSLHTPKNCRNYKRCLSLSEKSKKVYAKRQAVNQAYAATTQQIASVFAEYNEVRDLLERLGYMKGREFYPRGIFALELHVQEILVTELAFSGLLEDTEPAEAAAILAGIEFVPGRSTRVEMINLPALQQTHALRNQLLRLGVPEKFCIWSSLPCSLAYAWCNGASFNELLEMTSMQPGDIFSIFRREIDLLRQIERAAVGNTALIERVQQLRGLLDRDEIALTF